jgi:hypothetical protein
MGIYTPNITLFCINFIVYSKECQGNSVMEISNINFRDTLGRDTLEGLIVRNIVTVSRGVYLLKL